MHSRSSRRASTIQRRNSRRSVGRRGRHRYRRPPCRRVRGGGRLGATPWFDRGQRFSSNAGDAESIGDAAVARLRDDGAQRLPPGVPAARRVRARGAAPLGALPARGRAAPRRSGAATPTTRPAGVAGLLAPAEGEHAEVRVVDGRTYVSPWRMRLRVLAALLSFREAAAARAVGPVRARRRTPSAPPGAGHAPPARPGRGAVRAPEPVARADPVVRAVRRRASGRLGEDETGGTRLRYRTTTRRAMRRAEQAVRSLRRSDLGPISELIVDLHQWMAAFDPSSLLELDYGDALRLPHVGRAGRRSQRPRRARGARRAGARRVPTGRRHLPGRVDAWAEVRSRESDELTRR